MGLVAGVALDFLEVSSELLFVDEKVGALVVFHHIATGADATDDGPSFVPSGEELSHWLFLLAGLVTREETASLALWFVARVAHTPLTVTWMSGVAILVNWTFTLGAKELDGLGVNVVHDLDYIGTWGKSSGFKVLDSIRDDLLVVATVVEFAADLTDGHHKGIDEVLFVGLEVPRGADVPEGIFALLDGVDDAIFKVEAGRLVEHRLFLKSEYIKWLEVVKRPGLARFLHKKLQGTFRSLEFGECPAF
jgi:hypothetical protein